VYTGHSCWESRTTSSREVCTSAQRMHCSSFQHFEARAGIACMLVRRLATCKMHLQVMRYGSAKPKRELVMGRTG